MKQALILSLAIFASAGVASSSNLLFVATFGADSLDCGANITPCRTFHFALGLVDSGGTLKALDAVVDDHVFPLQPVTIDGSGLAIIFPLGSNAAIDTTGFAIPPSTKVVIRDLTIIAVSGFDGIHTNVAMDLENVRIAGQPRFGINVTGGSLTTKNVTVVGATSAGIQVNSSATAYLRDTIVRGSNVGVLASGPAAVQIERCELSFNTVGGLLVDASTGTPTTARISDTVITGNGIGIQASNGGQIISFRNNMLAGNTIDGATPFSVSLK